ncbi:hypothetical protein D3C81_1166500 [compost metagenome]
MPVRGHHHAAGHAVGDISAMVAAHQVQAAVQRGGGAGRREDAAIVDIERTAVEPDPGIARGEVIGPDPVGGRRPAVEQAGLGDHEGAQAQPGDARAAGAGGLQRRQQGRRRTFRRVAPGRHDHGIGLFQRAEVVLDLDAEARHGPDQAGLLAADQQPVARHAQHGEIVAEHDAGHGQVERADAFKGNHGDGVHRVLASRGV